MNVERKFKLFINPIKEEKWINKKMDEGYRLSHVSPFGLYTFEKTTDNYIVRIDFRTFKKTSYEEYINIHESMGWNCVYGSRLGTLYHYWLKKEDNVLSNELFSDRSDEIEYFNRLSTLMATFALLILVYLLTSFSLDVGWIQTVIFLTLMCILVLLVVNILKLQIMINLRKDDISDMKTNIITSVVKIVLFVFVAFLLLLLFDFLNLNDNGSGALNVFQNLSFFDFFNNPNFNGMLSLVVVLAVLAVILKILTLVFQKR